MPKLKFIHIPKNAGTSIEDWGRNYGYLWGRFDPDCPKHPDIKIQGIWHSPAKYWDKSDDIDYFCIIRHPYSRIISAINFLYPDGLNKELNNWIKDDLPTLVNKRFPTAFIPQYEYVYDTSTKEQLCKNILSFNDLTYNFKDLMIKYRCKYAYRDLPNSNITKNKRYKIDDLNKESINIIDKLYSKDFKLINLKQ